MFLKNLIFCSGFVLIVYFGCFNARHKTLDDVFDVKNSISYHRHVTKSMSQLKKMDDVNKHVLFLNGIPKSGSEILVVLLRWLQGTNNYRHVRLKNVKQRLTRSEEEDLVDETQRQIKEIAVPISFDRDVYFVNFSRFDKQSPTYINMIRDPADYLLARFHHVTNYKTKVKLQFQMEASYMKQKSLLKSLNLMVPYFCGHDPRCSLLNDEWALKKAKLNISKYYAAVGILEEVNATLEVFERKIPYFFKGVQEIYYKELLDPYARNANKTIKSSERFRVWARREIRTEYDLYEWNKMKLFDSH